MAVTNFLVDTSATARLRKPAVRERLLPLAERGLLYTCDLLDLEAGVTAKSVEDYDRIMADRAELYIRASMPENAFGRALDVQRRLAGIGHHRGVSMADLVIAITAAVHRLTVLHYDHDFEFISAVVGTSHQWVVERGTA